MNLNIELKEKGKLGYFETLEKAGVKNFYTFDNAHWGHMGIRDGNAVEKYKEIFETLKIQNEEFVYITSTHNNVVQFLDNDNLNIYRLFNNEENKYFTVVNTDALVTKLKIPLVIAPADCSIICITGVDKKDNKKFVSVIHAGIYGTMLNIHTKTLELIRDYYNPVDLSIFIFPSVSKKYYKKSLKDKYRGHLIHDKAWDGFVDIRNDEFGIDIEGKIVNDFIKSEIENIFITGLDSYEENKNDKLFSSTYLNAHNLEKKNFAVGVYIQ